MSETTKISFCIMASGPDLHLKVRLQDQLVYDGFPPPTQIPVTHEFDDSIEGEHILVFELSGKLPTHTKIDSDGNILEDRYISITDIAFDDIQLGHLSHKVTKYYHDHNGTSSPLIDDFYGIMGCNGRVEMRFTTPIYLWLLENM